MYKMDLALDNQQWLICHETKPNYYEFVEMNTGNATRFVSIYYRLFHFYTDLIEILTWLFN